MNKKWLSPLVLLPLPPPPVLLLLLLLLFLFLAGSKKISSCGDFGGLSDPDTNLVLEVVLPRVAPCSVCYITHVPPGLLCS